MSAIVLLNGGVSPMTPALSITHASALVLVPFPQLSPHVPSYRPITPSPCTLSQQVIALFITSYCFVAPHVLMNWIIASLYAIVLELLTILWLFLAQALSCLHMLATGSINSIRIPVVHAK